MESINTRRALTVAFVAVLGVAAMGYVPYRYLRQARARASLFESRWSRLRQDPASLEHYRADNARMLAAGRTPGRVVFLGASITEALDLARAFPDRPFVNRGIGGQLVWQELLRLNDDALALGPAAVVPEVCATNFDAAAPPLTETQLYLTQLAETSRARGVRPVLATVIPVSRTYAAENRDAPMNDRIRAMNDWIRTYARTHGDPVVDYAAALSDAQGYLPDALTDDGLHPNAAGQTRMLAAAREALVGI